MNYKLQTLHIIYDLVKNETNPCSCNITTNEIISRHHLPWDETLAHLNELASEGYISMKQFSTAVVSITDMGFQFATANSLLTA